MGIVSRRRQWRYSLVVRTGGFEPLNPGSIPGSAIVRKHERVDNLFQKRSLKRGCPSG